MSIITIVNRYIKLTCIYRLLRSLDALIIIILTIQTKEQDQRKDVFRDQRVAAESEKERGGTTKKEGKLLASSYEGVTSRANGALDRVKIPIIYAFMGLLN